MRNLSNTAASFKSTAPYIDNRKRQHGVAMLWSLAMRVESWDGIRINKTSWRILTTFSQLFGGDFQRLKYQTSAPIYVKGVFDIQERETII